MKALWLRISSVVTPQCGAFSGVAFRERQGASRRFLTRSERFAAHNQFTNCVSHHTSESRRRVMPDFGQGTRGRRH